MVLTITNAILTAYLWTGHVCSNGHYPKIGITITAPRNIPLGSKVLIGEHIYTVQDRTNKRFKDWRFDIYSGSDKKKALQFGKKIEQQVTIITP